MRLGRVGGELWSWVLVIIIPPNTQISTQIMSQPFICFTIKSLLYLKIISQRLIFFIFFTIKSLLSLQIISHLLIFFIFLTINYSFLSKLYLHPLIFHDKEYATGDKICSKSKTFSKILISWIRIVRNVMVCRGE